MTAPARGPVVLGEAGVFVPAEDAALLARQLDHLLAAVCRARPGVPRPRPPRALVDLRDACRQVAEAHVARQHRDRAQWINATATIATTGGQQEHSPTMISTVEAAHRSGRSSEYWRRRAATGRVPAIQVGRVWLLDPAAVAKAS